MTKISIITGATSGIGYEIAKIIAQEDTDILLIARNEENLQKVQEELTQISTHTVSYFALDLSSNLNNLQQQIQAKISDKQLLYLINNAGFGDFGEFAHCDLKKQQKMINLNILALTVLTKFYLENAPKNKPSYLLNVASIASYTAGPLMSVYYATKAYVLSFTRAIIFENHHNPYLNISLLCPGPTDTLFVKTANLENSSLFERLKTMTAKDVAHIAMRELKKGKKEIIPGLINKLLVYANKFAPRVLSEKITYKIMQKK